MSVMTVMQALGDRGMEQLYTIPASAIMGALFYLIGERFI